MDADAPLAVSAPANTAPERPQRRSDGIVLLAAAMALLLAVGLLLDSVTKPKSAPKREDSATAVAPPGAHDDFNRPDAVRSLGAAPSGQHWQQLAGAWGIVAHHAYVSTPASGPSLATVDVRTANGHLEVTAATIAAGFGLAFRCRGQFNCWRVEAVPKFGTWNIVKEVRGVETLIGNLGTVPVDSGTKIAVEMVGNQLRFAVNDREVKTIEDGDLSGETHAGISLREPGSARDAQWSSFLMKPLLGNGVIEASTAAIRDDFSRSDGSTLAANDSVPWRAIAGRFGIRNGYAALLSLPSAGPGLALVDTGAVDGVVQATVIAPQKLTGIAFRCRDANNCWYLEDLAGFGTWNLTKVVNGHAELMGNLGVVPTDPGTTVSVKLDGPHMTFSVNAKEVREIDDPFLQHERGAGLVVEPSRFATSARWSEFLFAPAGAAR